MDLPTQTTQLEPYMVRLKLASKFALVEKDEKFDSSLMISLVCGSQTWQVVAWNQIESGAGPSTEGILEKILFNNVSERQQNRR